MGNHSSMDQLMFCHDIHVRGKGKGMTKFDAHCAAGSDSEDDFVGSVVDDYDVEESKSLGDGRFSKVYLCWRKALPSKKYAMKVIDTTGPGAASRSQVEEEIFILRMLGDSAGIVRCIEADMTGDTIRIVLDLCVGGELYDAIRAKHHYTEHEARTTVHRILTGVAYVHSKGVMHRDLKPENILLIDRQRCTEVKISDFGLARAAKDYPRKLPRATTICGSDFYLAPELIMQQEYGREIDVWAVGVITYVILCGSLPFFDNVLHKLYRQIVERDLRFSEQPWKAVSKGAQDFIVRTLQVRPGERISAGDALSHMWIYDPTRNNRVEPQPGAGIFVESRPATHQ